MYYWSSHTINKGWIVLRISHIYAKANTLSIRNEKNWSLEITWPTAIQSCNCKITRTAPQTIHTEVKNGTVRQIKRQVQKGKTYGYEPFVYSADAGQASYERAQVNCRKQPKWVAAPDFMAYADYQMKKKKYSPDVHVGRAKKLNLFPHEEIPCTTTLYNYIDLGLMETKNIDQHLKIRRKTNKSRNRWNKKFLAIWSRNDRIWWINGNASALYLEGNTYGTCIPIIDTACPRLDEQVTKKNIRLRHSPRECLLEEMSKLALTAAWAWWWDSLAWWSLDSSLELISVLLPNLLCAVPCPSSFSSAC